MSHIIIRNYDTEKYNFADMLQNLYNVTSLTQVHVLDPELCAGEWAAVRFDNEVKTYFHQVFYGKLREPWNEFVDAYNSFIKNEIAPLFNEDFAYQIIEAFSENLNRYSSGYSFMLHAINFMEGPSYEVIIVADKDELNDVVHTIHNAKQFNKVLVYKDINNTLINDFSYLENYTTDENGNYQVYVCKNYACNLPTSDISLIINSLFELYIFTKFEFSCKI